MITRGTALALLGLMWIGRGLVIAHDPGIPNPDGSARLVGHTGPHRDRGGRPLSEFGSSSPPDPMSRPRPRPTKTLGSPTPYRRSACTANP